MADLTERRRGAVAAGFFFRPPLRRRLERRGMARTIDPGKFRRRIEIHTNTPTEDDTGQVIKAFGIADTVWGSVEPVRGLERFEALQVKSMVTHRITIRDYALTPEDLLKDAEDTTIEWHIESVLRLDDQGARYLEVWAKEVVKVP